MPIPARPPARTPHRRSRRRLGWAAAGFAALLVVVGVVALARPPGGDVGVPPQGAVSTIPSATQNRADDSQTSVSGSTNPPPLDEAPIPGVELFVEGQILDLGTLPPRETIRLSGTETSAGPPVRTRFGLVVATGPLYTATLFFVGDDGGPPRVLAESVGSFAVAPEGATIAWAEHLGRVGAPGPSTRLVAARLPDGETVHTTVFEGFAVEGSSTGFARIVGFSGDVVLLGTGDGAAAVAATWVPAEDRLTPIDGYGGVGAGSPTGAAAFYQGDGLCLVFVTVAEDGSVVPPDGGLVTDTLDCWTGRAPVFSPDGGLLASAGAVGDRGPAALTVTATDGRELHRIAIAGIPERFFVPEQIRWVDQDRVVLLGRSWDSNPQQAHVGIYRCSLTGASCELAQSVALEDEGWYTVSLVTRLSSAG